MSTVQDILDRKGGSVLTIDSRATVLEAIGIMSQANIGALVVEADDKPEGIFTERDYLRKIALKGRASNDTEVREVMSAPLITISPAEPVEVAMETMTTCRCRHLIVSNGVEVDGIISLGDCVKHLLSEKEAEIEQLSHYIAGSY